MSGRRWFVLAVVLALIAGAATPTPVKITADQFTVTESKQQATFTGNVVVIRGTMTVWAPKVVVDYGEGGPSNIEKFVATGGVRIKTSDQDATGSRAEYSPKTQILRLSGDVTVTNASGTLKGPELVLDLANNISTFSGSGGGRVTGVFTPQ
ncbi:MAG TPA: lipopolysaccharide transport periplasmic protein LptA [Devosia sp.]|nr:lipopolysaccharide transport periplasmic protein LptA [Devosia sp.]